MAVISQTSTRSNLSHLSFRHEADQLSEAYLRLYTFAGDHPEAQEIFMAID